MELKTEISINASPERLWEVFTKFDDYPHWNPFIKLVQGEVKVGNKVTVMMKPPGGKQMTFKPRIVTFEQNKELKWIGYLLFPGVFDGEHKFEIVDNGNGTSTFRQSETFKGILVPLFKNKLETNVKNGFNQMNESLKKLIE